MTLWMRPRRNDEADRAKWPDLSGLGHHGALQGFTAWDGVTDGWTDDPALLFAGDNDRVEIPSTGLDMGTGDYTIDAWCKAPEDYPVDNSGLIIGVGHYNQDASWALHVWDTALRGMFAGVPYATSRTLTPGYDWRGKGLLHAVVTFDRDGLMTLYANNVIVGSSSIAAWAAHDLQAGARKMYMGWYSGWYAKEYTFSARIYKGVALTPEQIAHNYAAGPHGTGYVTDGLVLDLNAAYCVPVLPKLVYSSGQEALSWR